MEQERTCKHKIACCDVPTPNRKKNLEGYRSICYACVRERCIGSLFGLHHLSRFRNLQRQSIRIVLQTPYRPSQLPPRLASLSYFGVCIIKFRSTLGVYLPNGVPPNDLIVCRLSGHLGCFLVCCAVVARLEYSGFDQFR